MTVAHEVSGRDTSRCAPWHGVSGIDALAAAAGQADPPPASHWSMGEGMWLTTAEHRGIRLARNRIGHFGGGAVLVVAVPGNDAWTLCRGPGDEADPRTLIVLDVLSPFDFRASGPGSLVSLQVPQEWLALAPETVRSGIEHLTDVNPLLGFVRDHVLHLARLGAECPELLPDLAAPASAVVRSLILTAVESGGRSGSSELIASVKNYIDDHLTETTLCADTIAVAHHVSTRKLYAEWPRADGGLSDYIIRRRLGRARDALVVQRYLTIPAVARTHGFSDPTHFAKRFRAAYGISPSQWRRDNAVS